MWKMSGTADRKSKVLHRGAARRSGGKVDIGLPRLGNHLGLVYFLSEGPAFAPGAGGSQRCPTPPVPETTPVELPWTRLASDCLGEEAIVRDSPSLEKKVERTGDQPGD